MRFSQLFISVVLFLIIFLLVWVGYREAPLPVVFAHSDKIVHLFAFATVSYLCRMVFTNIPAICFWSIIAVAAVVLEFIQEIYQPSRFSEMEDAIANLFGVGLGLISYYLLATKKKSENS